MKVPFRARTQAEPPAPHGESTTCASVGQAVSPATDFHHRLIAPFHARIMGQETGTAQALCLQNLPVLPETHPL